MEQSAAEAVKRMVGERERVVGLLRARAPELRAQGVRTLALFGSVARGEARPDSDVDLLVELDQDTKLGFRVVGQQDDLRRLLGREVGLTFAGGAAPARVPRAHRPRPRPGVRVMGRRALPRRRRRTVPMDERAESLGRRSAQPTLKELLLETGCRLDFRLPRRGLRRRRKLTFASRG